MRIQRSRAILFGALALIGLFNAALFVKPWAKDHVQPTAMAVAAAPAPEATSVGVNALLSVGKTALLSQPESDELRAGLMFASYFLLSTRALHSACERVGIDISRYVQAFATAHEAQYQKASTRLSGNGLNAEFVWGFFGSQLQEMAGRHLDQYAFRAGTAGGADTAGGHAEACAEIAARPDAFVKARDFAERYPKLHAALMLQ
jgi:hypothetical protein